ncbi:uncharacterized protein LOC110996663 [Pieris rapae]|uniref:uncharacterized protein LOC110996663 n=1 Tax=Pieris rapae TaxID=64459 RepID=UPI001E27D5CF|nr:uncharacterized protein LOC110996663 [Pieris rapae]
MEEIKNILQTMREAIYQQKLDMQDMMEAPPPPLPSRLVTVGEKDYYPSNPKIKNNSLKIVNRQKDNQHLYIATINTLTLRKEESLTELILAIEKIHWSIIGLSEVRRLGEEIEDHGNFVFYFKGETSGKYGVGFLIKKELKKNIEEFLGISERIAILNITMPQSNAKWSIVQIYSPTEQASNADVDSFYADLRRAILNYTHKNLIVMGDYNAQLGKRRKGEEIILGPYCTGKRNRNGTKLIELVYENNLKVLNSMYKKRPSNRWTWISPNGLYKNEIDFILTNRANMFSDCTILKNLNFNTNHRMVRANLKIKLDKTRPFKARTSESKHLIGNISEIKEHLIQLNLEELSVQEKYNNVLEAITYSSNRVPPNRNKWHSVSDETSLLLKQRQELIKLENKTKSIRVEITKLSKQIKLSLRQDIQKLRLDTLERYINKTGGIKKAVKELKTNINWIPNINNKRGYKITKRPDIVSTATDFYKQLYSTQTSRKKETTLEDGEEVPDILPREVERAIETLKKDKSPGPDYVTNELLISLKEVLVPTFTVLFNEIVRTESIPEQWANSTITLIHKKGDKSDINNYRPISSITNIYKVFAKIILHRLGKILDDNQPIEQAGGIINIERGVRQGDPLSPKLFSAVLEEIFKKLSWDKYGLMINGERLNHLRFADDLILFASTRDELEKMVSDLDTESRFVGLKMNTEKTKVMTNSRKEKVLLNNNIIEYVDEYLYLGQTISMTDSTTKEIDTRIAKAWKSFWALKEVMKNKKTSMVIKRKVFNTCVLPVLTYGSQTWAPTKAQYTKLQVCQRAMERCMIGKTRRDKIKNTVLRKITKIPGYYAA